MYTNMYTHMSSIDLFSCVFACLHFSYFIENVSNYLQVLCDLPHWGR